ncbi:predicted protein [Sclerotinia sclerotiorum 1980 UF-70]|uniref:Uncharacterized protein n=1 Tax=Sclerotinia sclerotiorum (strain ATCC 18683 / 1980 / Ss-1) TaxID=665079 RepID=A7F1S8_SCLS1|nr:predicted protein [Sclerotinia sclerotiorum 1980 UF-70]EDN95670.1 predicted protein [Sclerotinia sclerotiorum 1980 UF-70]
MLVREGYGRRSTHGLRRNKVNEAFKKAGINGLIISVIITTRSGNFIPIINNPFNIQFLMEKKEIWDCL